MSIEKNKIYCQAENCLLEEMDNDILLYNPANTQTLHLNETSSLVWQLLDGERSVEVLIQLLQQEFPESHDQIEQDVLEVLEKMHESGAIIVEGS